MSNLLDRNFRFDSPTPPVDQTASLVKVLVHCAASRAVMGRFCLLRPRNPHKCRWSNRLRRHFSLAVFPHQNLLRCAGRLSVIM